MADAELKLIPLPPPADLQYRRSQRVPEATLGPRPARSARSSVGHGLGLGEAAERVDEQWVVAVFTDRRSHETGSELG